MRTFKMIAINPIKINTYQNRNKQISYKGFFAKPTSEEITQKLLKIAPNDESRDLLISLSATNDNPVCYWQSTQLVQKKLSRQIKYQYSNDRELSKILEDVMLTRKMEVIPERGIPALREYANKSPKNKETAINLLLDLINCDEVRDDIGHYNSFFGIDTLTQTYVENAKHKYEYTGITEEKCKNPGYLLLYKELTSGNY